MEVNIILRIISTLSTTLVRCIQFRSEMPSADYPVEFLNLDKKTDNSRYHSAAVREIIRFSQSVVLSLRQWRSNRQRFDAGGKLSLSDEWRVTSGEITFPFWEQGEPRSPQRNSELAF